MHKTTIHQQMMHDFGFRDTDILHMMNTRLIYNLPRHSRVSGLGFSTTP